MFNEALPIQRSAHCEIVGCGTMGVVSGIPKPPSVIRKLNDEPIVAIDKIGLFSLDLQEM